MKRKADDAEAWKMRSDKMEKIRKNVLLLCSYQSPYGGNFIPSLISLEKELLNRGFNCIYVFPHLAKDRYWFQILSKSSHVMTMNFDVGKFSFVTALSSIIRDNRISIVYAHFGKYIETEIACLLNKNVYGVGHIHSDFSMGHVSHREKCFRFIVYKLLAAKMRFISVSPGFVEYNPMKIKHIANALAEERITCEHVSGAALRKNIGIQDDEILCEVFGWTPDVKGVDIAVNAVGKVNELVDKKVKLAIICGVAVGKKQMKDYIRTHTSYTGEEEFLRYLEPTEDVFSYHEASDILLMVSRSEGFSYTLLEMLSIGKKCVVSKLPGTKWVFDYPNTFLFTSENLDECIDCITRAVNATNEHNTNTIQKVKSRFSINKWSIQIAEYLTSK